MKFLALRYTVAGKPQLMVDTLQPANVTERYAFIRAHTPEDNPRLVEEELPDPATADTLPPPADPFSHASIDRDVRGGRAEMPTLDDATCGSVSKSGIQCARPKGHYGTHECVDLAWTEREAARPDTLLDRDRRENAGILAGRKG